MLYDVAKYGAIALVAGIAWTFGSNVGQDAYNGVNTLMTMANEQIKKWRADGQTAKAEALERDVATAMQKHGLPAPAFN